MDLDSFHLGYHGKPMPEEGNQASYDAGMDLKEKMELLRGQTEIHGFIAEAMGNLKATGGEVKNHKHLLDGQAREVLVNTNPIMMYINDPDLKESPLIEELREEIFGVGGKGIIGICLQKDLELFDPDSPLLDCYKK
ncbi:MAG: hypothetical protein ABIH34_08290 [Nanoarchaeota archaeon]